MNERELTIDDLSSPYDEQSVAMFSYGGPVGEDMEDDEQPSVQYFAQGGEVEEAQAILTRIPARPTVQPTAAPRRTAAQMLQTFAEGGEVQKTPFPDLLDISRQVNAAGAPVEKLYAPTTAPASASVPSQINIPTFQPVAAPPTGPSIMTPTPAPLTGLGAQPTLSQPVTAPTSTARSLFEQINPAALAATPTYTTPTFTPTVQTFTKPTLLTKEELQKAQPPLVRYEPSATYGGLETYKGPLQTSPYVDIPGAPGSDGAPAPAPAAPANMTPGGYKYTTYVSLTPDQLVGLGNKAQLGQTFTGIVKRQQDDATAIRTEFNNAIASGDIETATALRPLLVQKEADVRQAITDQGLVNKYFTGVGGAFETPEQYRQRVQAARLTGSRLGPELTSVSLEGLQYKLPETSAKGAVPTPFAAQVNTQKAEYDAAVAVYENLASAYGRENPFVKNYLAEVVTPQKADYDMLIAKPVSTAATAADRLLSSPTLAKAYTPPRISPTFRVSNTMAAFKGIVGGLETSVKQLTTARDAAAASGLTGYVSQLDEALAAEQGKLSKALEDRQAAVDNSLPDPVKRAMGSPPEGEMLESQSRALLKKLSGGSEANTVPLQKFSKGGAVKKAAELLKSLGVAEGKVAGKELTTMQDFHTSLGDSIRERAAKMQQQMDAMQFKYGPGQYVFTEDSARKNFSPFKILGRTMVGNNPIREPHPDHPMMGKVVKDPVTGKTLRTPYEPGYKVRHERGPDDWAEFNIPESAIKGTVDGFAKGGPVNRAQGSPIYGEIPDSGPITADTRAAFKAKGPSASSVVGESARMLRNIMGEGLSNLESRIRGSVATIPGTFGDIESIFRESDKTRKLATTEEVLRDYMPGRLTTPTKEAKGFEELGTYLPLAIPAGAVTKTAGAVKTGARKALEELGPTAGSILERAVPKFGILPEGPSAPTNLAQRVEQGKFFKGRLDDFVSQVRNPVTKQQFLGSLKGKFREYDISRAAQALADLDDAAKLTPTDLVSRISAVATPNRYKTTFIEPKTSGLHNNYDNVYGATGQPVGVINLAYEPTRAMVEAEEASAGARSAAAALGRGSSDTDKIQILRSFLDTSEDLAKSPEEKARLVTGLNNLETQLAATRGEADIVLKELNDINYLNVPEFENWYPTVSERRKAIPKSLPLDSDAYKSAWKAIDDQATAEVKVQALRRVIQENPVARSVLDRFAKEEFTPAYKSAEEMLQDSGPNYVVKDILPYVKRVVESTAKDSTNALLVDNKALLDDILKQAQKYSTYKGSHTAVNPEKNAMGFSRFTEHQVNVPGLGKLDGIYVSELQSDMFRDIKKLGKKGGSAAKDKQEMVSLLEGVKSKLEPLRPQIEERFGSMDSFMFVMRGDMTGKADPAAFSDLLTTLGPISKGKADQLATDTIKDVKRITKLQERLGLPGGQVKGTYDIEEPIANIEVQPQVVQQLLAKNAIAGAMKMNKSFVAFPGTESKQAKLYEKLPNNLKAVVKDLGEGFVIQPITIKDATGVERSHWAVLWDNNAAQRVLNQGVPFKKGGLVEKSAINNRRYI